MWKFHVFITVYFFSRDLKYINKQLRALLRRKLLKRSIYNFSWKFHTFVTICTFRGSNDFLLAKYTNLRSSLHRKLLELFMEISYICNFQRNTNSNDILIKIYKLSALYCTVKFFLFLRYKFTHVRTRRLSLHRNDNELTSK